MTVAGSLPRPRLWAFRRAAEHKIVRVDRDTRIRVQIEGHSDERGTPEYNIALSQKRAQSVKSYLLNLGVS